MTDADTYRLSDRYAKDDGTVFMTGIQALARLPIEQLRIDRRAGLRTAAFAAGYPGSPLGGLDGAFERAVREAPDLPITLRPSVNEEYAATAVMGSQLAAARPDARYDGVVGLWYGKAPGVDRAADALRHAVFAGADPHGGAVAIVGDDPAAKSSTIPSTSAGVLASMHIPVLYPGDPGEALDLGRHAIALSRASGLWVSLKIVADVADGSGTVALDSERVSPVIPTVDGAPYDHRPNGLLLTPRSLDIEREIVEVRAPLALEYAAANRLNHVTIDPPDAWIGIIASGITYRELREALRRVGLESDREIAAAGIRLLKLGMPLPFNASTIRSFARGVERILVVEEKTPNVESLVKDALYNASHHPTVVGRTDEFEEPLVPAAGALHADELIAVLRTTLAERVGERLRPETRERERIPLSVARTPYFCSGCPHNRSTVVEEGTLVGAGIGCHTMILLGDEPRYGDIAGLTCMGNEGTQWIGMAPFVETPHMVQNLGDGTFFHSGQLAVTAAIAAEANITYKLLWNGAVAMTGGQDPTGGIGLDRVCAQLLAQGVRRVIVTSEDPGRARALRLPPEVDVWDRDRLAEAQRTLAAIPGVTVLIHDQRCAAEARRDRKRGLVETPPTRVVINHRVCEGCGDCARVSNCLSVQPIETDFGRKTTIEQHSCNLDLSCLEGDCPAFVSITRPPSRWWRRARPEDARTNVAAAPADLPAPVPHDADDVSVHITGIGGTGVVTASQLLGTAAMFDGAEVHGLDQIGLSQKAGPVVSDVRITHGRQPGSSRVGAGQADLLLAFDLLVASSWTGLEAADPDRTSVVGSLELTPPGAKTAHPETEMPTKDLLLHRIAEGTREGQRHWADASEICADLIGDTVGANVFVIGMAVQAGLLPVRPESIERAIELNAVAVEVNREAFRWGRWQVADPTKVDAARGSRVGATAANPLPAGLDDRAREIADGDEAMCSEIRRFTGELIAFQNTRLASRYLDELEMLRRSTGSSALVAATAAGLFKLMAYKDEYEVARLMLDADGQREVAAVARRGDRVAWRLHPPTLRALGRSSKLSVSTRWRPAIGLLVKGKRLRGTVLDPFGRAEVRRVERALPSEYLSAIHTALGAAPAADAIDRAIAIAEAAELVRGYEGVKLANVERFRAALADLAST
ncbi:MAG: indolepyruvate ferredoxin oxidoreductase family protein [Acidimicrobiales bacterium]